MAFEKLGIDKKDDRATAMKIAFEKLEQKKLKSQQKQLNYTGKAVNLFFPSFEKNQLEELIFVCFSLFDKLIELKKTRVIKRNLIYYENIK